MLRMFLQLVLWTIFFGITILWPAGTWKYPGGLAALGIFFLGGCWVAFRMYRKNPRLANERMKPWTQKDQKTWDKWFLWIFVILFIAWLPFMAWDAAKANFTAVPWWLQGVGFMLILMYGFGVSRVFRENTFATPEVKIQADQYVVDTGPYAIVRHPMYACTFLLMIGLPLLLGSWKGLWFSVACIFGLVWRILGEEKALKNELPGYADYMKRVKYRLIPHVW